MLYHHNIRVSEITMLGLHERGMPRCPVCNGNKGYYSLKPIIEYYKKNKTLDGVEESKIYPTAYCVECLAPILLKDIIQQKKEEQG